MVKRELSYPTCCWRCDGLLGKVENHGSCTTVLQKPGRYLHNWIHDNQIFADWHGWISNVHKGSKAVGNNWKAGHTQWRNVPGCESSNPHILWVKLQAGRSERQTTCGLGNRSLKGQHRGAPSQLGGSWRMIWLIGFTLKITERLKLMQQALDWTKTNAVIWIWFQMVPRKAKRLKTLWMFMQKGCVWFVTYLFFTVLRHFLLFFSSSILPVMHMGAPV